MWQAEKQKFTRCQVNGMAEAQRTQFAQIWMRAMQVVPGMTAGRDLCQLDLGMKEQETCQFSPGVARPTGNGNAQSIHRITPCCMPLST